MRIDLSRPIPGLLMALPLIAILLSVSRVPISAAIETTGTAAIACAPDIGGQTDRAMSARLDDGGGDRWDSLALVGEQKWHNRPEAAIGCEVLVSCQPRSIVRRFAVYD